MTYAQVEQELALIDQIKSEALSVKKRKDTRFKNNQAIRAWRLNIKANIKHIEGKKRVAKDKVEYIRLEIKAVNNFLNNSNTFNINSTLEKLKEQVVAQDDIFQELWSLLNPLKSLSLPANAQSFLDDEISTIESEVKEKYQKMQSWQEDFSKNAHIGDEFQSQKNELFNTRKKINDSLGFKAVKIKNNQSTSTIEIVKDEDNINLTANLTFEKIKNGENLSLSEDIIQKIDNAESLEHIEKVLLDATEIELNKHTTKVYGNLKSINYRDKITSRLHFNKLNKLLYEDGLDIPETVVAELDEYRQGRYENTQNNADRINEIANQYGTLDIDISFGNISDSTELASLLSQLQALAESMYREDANSKQGVKIVRKLINNTNNFLSKVDYQAQTFNSYYEEFNSSCAELKNWVNNNWYQAGGTPDNHKKAFAGDVETYVKPGASHAWSGGVG